MFLLFIVLKLVIQFFINLGNIKHRKSKLCRCFKEVFNQKIKFLILLLFIIYVYYILFTGSGTQYNVRDLFVSDNFVKPSDGNAVNEPPGGGGAESVSGRSVWQVDAVSILEAALLLEGLFYYRITIVCVFTYNCSYIMLGCLMSAINTGSGFTPMYLHIQYWHRWLYNIRILYRIVITIERLYISMGPARTSTYFTGVYL